MFKWTFQTEPYGTHQPVLYTMVRYTNIWDGPILELGSGFNSTELIHYTANRTRLITTIDNDKEWLSKFSHLIKQNRYLVLVDSWDEIIKKFGDFYYDLVFVDQGCWQSRADCLRAFKNDAKFLIVHDSDYLEREGLIKFSDEFKYAKTFMPLEPYPYHTGPPTTLLSNFINVENITVNYKDFVNLCK